MKHFDAELHVKGTSLFMDDFPAQENLLHAAVLVSPVAHGEIVKVEIEKAEGMPGVKTVITAKDIPGENQIGNIIMDEPLLAEERVHFIGEPIAVVLADNPHTARNAVKAINLDIRELPAVTDPREAYAKGMLISPPRTFSLGDTSPVWDRCDVVVEGKADSGGQEHVYLETQGSVAVPLENNCIRIYAGTQGPTFVQKVASRVLGIPMNKVEVDVGRLGGAFGGKEDQATPWAVMAALGVQITKQPVKIILNRNEDMTWTGKRHPYTSDFKLGLSKDGKIQGFEVTYYQNGGATSDLSTAILERTLFHSTNAYFIPDVKATGICCRTNLPPNTAFRGFGAPQAMFVLESAIHKAADLMGIDPEQIQERNLLNSGDEFPYGMTYEGDEIRRSWKRINELHNPEKVRDEIKEFNSTNMLKKKGISLIPVCFGISFTNITLNQANALVHVYTDGSVGVSTGAVEMGQGVNSKIRQITARTFSINIDKVKVETTNTTRAANTSPTAASSAADMNGNAVRIACGNILCRLLTLARKQLEVPEKDHIELRNETVTINGIGTDLVWEELVGRAYRDRVSLSSQAHYATPGLHFDTSEEKGRPFAYHVTGTALTEVTLDRLRGTYTVDSVKIVHDCGTSINLLVDRGQIEGGLLQGIGWVTLEELKYRNETHSLLSDSLATYKIPDIYFAPDEVQIEFLENLSGNGGIFNSKAVGEPPFMYGIGTFFALLNALRECNPGIEPEYSTPLSAEKILLLLAQSSN